jgi:hypothetical protein
MIRIFAGAAAVMLLAGVAGEAVADEAVTFEEVVHLSCAEVAGQAGDDEALIVEMVTVLARFSLEQRGLVVPEDREGLGQQFGELIKAFCTAEPDGLLYNAVHRAMLRLL